MVIPGESARNKEPKTNNEQKQEPREHLQVVKAEMAKEKDLETVELPLEPSVLQPHQGGTRKVELKAEMTKEQRTGQEGNALEWIEIEKQKSEPGKVEVVQIVVITEMTREQRMVHGD